jgi:hypothetical protein
VACPPVRVTTQPRSATMLRQAHDAAGSTIAPALAARVLASASMYVADTIAAPATAPVSVNRAGLLLCSARRRIDAIPSARTSEAWGRSHRAESGA